MAVGTRPWIEAWDDALYGAEGFFTHEQPADHFRTGAAHSPLLAEAVLSLVRREGLPGVVDLGAGSGELLARLHELAPDLALTGVEVRRRPPGLPAAVRWTATLPERVDGLLLAHELLDDVPCVIVQVDEQGTPREVVVERDGTEHLGREVQDPWLDRWWPLCKPGTRAEIGSTRDTTWAAAVARCHGVALAVDYGHLRADRPPFGSLTSFLHGHEVDVVPDGSRDVTAHVAVDALAERVGGRLERQADALAALGVHGRRPALALAGTDPVGYVRALARAGDAAELTRRGGWGDFWWVLTDTRTAA